MMTIPIRPPRKIIRRLRDLRMISPPRALSAEIFSGLDLGFDFSSMGLLTATKV